MPNVELLEKTLKYIEEHPEEWDQAEWFCGTVACFAGHVVGLARCDELQGVGSYPGSVIAREAQNLLEINDDAAEFLFEAGHGLEDLKNIVTAMISPDQTDLEDMLTNYYSERYWD